MAPKGRPKRSSSSAAATSSSSTVAPLPAEATLLQSHEHDEAQSSKRRCLQRRSSEAAVSKALADNFREFNELQTDVLQVNGQTLRERLTSDKRRQKDGDKKMAMGAAYYKARRAEYGEVAGASETVLKPKKADELINADFKEAIVRMQQSPSKPLGLLDWCRGGCMLNQRELCGFYKTQLLLRHDGQPLESGTCIGTMIPPPS